jgi:hypothetical protein
VWILTRAKLKEGEGKIKTFNTKIGHATRRRKMGDEELRKHYENNFHKDFYRMSDRVEKSFADYEKRVEKEKKKKAKEEDNASVNHESGGDPPEPPSPSSSSIYSSSFSSFSTFSSLSSF